MGINFFFNCKNPAWLGSIVNLKVVKKSMIMLENFSRLSRDYQ